MFDIPLHPLIVHFPMVLAAFLPLAALAALVAGFRTGKPSKYWVLAVLLNALLFGSAFLAVQTGNKDEDRVEKILASEDPLERHEEKAELFMKLTGAALAIAALGFAPGALGLTGRILGTSASLALLVLGMQVGHSGGQLVYKHGAAAAFTMDRGPGVGVGAGPTPRNEKGEDED